MFGAEPSDTARHCAALLRAEGCSRLLELGAGQGRDTAFFAAQGFEVCAMDYSHNGLAALASRLEDEGLAQRVTLLPHDVRTPLPLPNASQDACFAHMLFCMALTLEELEAAFAEVRRVLAPGGVCVYTVRHVEDAHYGVGRHCGVDMYEHGGYVVHYFRPETVQRLAAGFALEEMTRIEEGALPRKLYRVTLRKA